MIYHPFDTSFFLSMVENKEEANSFAIKVAVIDKETNVIKNVILLKSLDEFVSDEYYIVEVPSKTEEVDPELQALEKTFKEIDPTYEISKPRLIEPEITIDETKWSEEKGFYKD